MSIVDFTKLIDTERLFPCRKEDLLDFAERQGCSQIILDNIQVLDNEELDDIYEAFPVLEELSDLLNGCYEAA